MLLSQFILGAIICVLIICCILIGVNKSSTQATDGYWVNFRNLIPTNEVANIDIVKGYTLTILPLDNDGKIIYNSLSFSPKTDIFIHISWMGYADLPRIKFYEEFMQMFLKDKPDPFAETDLRIFFNVLMTHLFYIVYRQKYNLATRLPYDDDMEKKVINFLNRDTFQYDAINSSEKDVYIYDELFEENTIRTSTTYVSSILTAISIVESIYLIIRYHKSKMLIDLLRRIYMRLSKAIFDDFLQIRGTRSSIALHFYKPNLLKALHLCNQIDPTLSIGYEFMRQFITLDEIAKKLFTLSPRYYVQPTNKLNKFQHYSFNDGSIVLRNNKHCLEFASGISKVEPGYLNYGFNYVSINQNMPTLSLSGQFVKAFTVEPLICTAVPLDDSGDIFYTSHHTKDSVCDGYYNSLVGIHEYSINFRSDIDYYVIFSWASIDMASAYSLKSDSKDIYEVFVLCHNVTFKITSSHAMEISQNSPYLGYIKLVKPQQNLNYSFKIERLTSTKKIEILKPTITRSPTFDSKFTAITPDTINIVDFAIVTYKKRRFVIYTNYDQRDYTSDYIKSITYNEKTYPMIMKSMRLYTEITNDDLSEPDNNVEA